MDYIIRKTQPGDESDLAYIQTENLIVLPGGIRQGIRICRNMRNSYL